MDDMMVVRTGIVQHAKSSQSFGVAEGARSSGYYIPRMQTTGARWPFRPCLTGASGRAIDSGQYHGRLQPIKQPRLRALLTDRDRISVRTRGSSWIRAWRRPSST